MMNNIEDNKKLTKKFPFLIPKNRWTGNIDPEYDYSYTELDAMPDGWRKAFGIQMCEDIQKELDTYSEKIRNDYCITQIKEKYGTLRWYTNWTTEGLETIIRKYEELSSKTCIDCGKPATKIGKGWISPYCDSCASKFEQLGESFMPIEEYYSNDKL